MAYEITSGRIAKAVKFVIYGPEGIGKSHFLKNFPGVVFIDTEGSTNHMDVPRLPAPSSWAMLLDELRAVMDGEVRCGTLALDTADWAEKLCIAHICAVNKVNGIEDFGYGKGYTYVFEEFGKMINLLSEIINRGINVAIAAHAAMRKFEQPDEQGAYDRWELKLINSQKCSVAGMLKEWSDILLFANYKTTVIKEDKNSKAKAYGGQRVVYTTHHPCWDAKNRFGLPEEIPLDFSVLAPYIPNTLEHIAKAAVNAGIPVSIVPRAQQTDVEHAPAPVVDAKDEIPNDWAEGGHVIDVPFGMPDALTDLMTRDEISQKEIEHAVALRGYYPENTPLHNYDPEFIMGVIVGAWPQIKEMIFELRKTEGNKHEY